MTDVGAASEHGGRVAGDGGPLVVLQAGAVGTWRGGDLPEDGGESDYEAACAIDEPGVLRRHGRDLLVLNDSEWEGHIFRLDDGTVVLEQPFYAADDQPSARELLGGPADRSFPFQVVDRGLRLLVGVETGDGPEYGFADVAITPGPKRCDVYERDHTLVIVLRSVQD